MRTEALLLLLLVSVPRALLADELDALINLDRMGRDSILGQPAPDALLPLIRNGETIITFVPDFGDSVGKTDFHMKLDWTFDFKYTLSPADPHHTVTLTPLRVRIMPRVRHVIRLPLTFYERHVWETPLLRHEFDHVAVSLDPRAQMLLDHLCQSLPPSSFVLEPTGGTEPPRPSDERVRMLINRQIEDRHAAIRALVQANYLRLDRLSQHGRIPIPKRAEFFEQLYRRANLEESRFPYLTEVAEFLESETYRQARPLATATLP